MMAVFALSLVATHTHAADLVQVTVDLNSPISDPVSPNLASFSIEVGSTLGWLGRYPAPTKPTFIALMKQLTLNEKQQGPIIRVGGNSADESWWNPSGQKRPNGITYDITEADLQSYQAAAKATNSKFILGLNFRQQATAEWAVAHAAAVENYIGWDQILALEIGNECDLYYQSGIRPKNYSFSNYLGDWQFYAAAINSGLKSPPAKLFQAATWAGTGWIDDVSTFLKGSFNLQSFSLHNYPHSHCSNRTVKMSDILNDAASESYASLIASKHVVPDVTNAGIYFNVGEGNSVSCGGMPGVSNVFGSSLWAIDTLFNMAKTGMKHWNFHGGGITTTSYSAFVYEGGETDQIPIVQPLYYGLRLFAEATRDNLQLVNNTITTTNNFIKVHSGYTDNNTLVVVVVHKDLNATLPAKVIVTVDAGIKSYPNGMLWRLAALNAYTEFGIRLANRTYDKTQDGYPSGTEYIETVTPADPSKGVYTVTIDPISALVMKFHLGPKELAK